jgi:hypothetical protein
MQKLILYGTIFFLILQPIIEGTQVRTHPNVDLSLSLDTYEKVLNIIFPRDEDDFSDPSKKYSLILRFLPAFEREYQINITKRWDGSVTVIKHAVREKSLEVQLQRILEQTGREDAEEMAKLIKVDKLEIKTPLTKVIKRFFTLPLSLESDVRLVADGARYELWFGTSVNDAHFTFLGPGLGKSRYDNPIIGWMNDVLEVVQQAANGKRR